MQSCSRRWVKINIFLLFAAYTQATESLRVVLTDIQHGQEVLQRFKGDNEPLVKVLSNFENMESHGKLIKLVHRQLITWTPLKEGITLL